MIRLVLEFMTQEEFFKIIALTYFSGGQIRKWSYVVLPQQETTISSRICVG
jgi:hypothetical protein